LGKYNRARAVNDPKPNEGLDFAVTLESANSERSQFPFPSRAWGAYPIGKVKACSCGRGVPT
jgi:hypothetical protein